MLYRSRRRRGNLLMVALTLAIILAVLVSALHNYEVVTRRALSGDEADVLLVQARKWEMARALKKVPASLSMPSDILVNTNPTALKNEIVVTDQMGQSLFSRNADGAWNGYPNLLVKRVYQMDPAAPDLPAPPNFKEYRGTPRSSNSSYDLYKGRSYRHMTGDFLPVAALAPRGSIHLDGCTSWPNPDMDDKDAKAWERFSGLPVHVAAGTTAEVDGMTYGTVHAVQSITLTNSTLALPQIGPLPYSPQIPATLLGQIDESAATLSKVAQTLDDKTLQISGEPPTISNMMDLIFTDAVGGDGQAVTKKLLGWLSVRSAVEFPFISLPGFATMAVPGTYFSFQLWFHAPFAPDSQGLTSTGGQTPNELAEDLSARMAALQKARTAVAYMLEQIRGGNAISDTPLGDLRGKAGDVYWEPEGGYDSNNQPIGKMIKKTIPPGDGKLPQTTVNPGLKVRGATLQADLETDLATLEQAKKDGATAAVTTGLKTNQGMLMWMADYQGYLYDDSGQVPKTGVDSGLGLGVDTVPFNLSATGSSPDTSDMYRNDVGYPMLNQGLLKSKAVFAKTKDFKGNPSPQRDPSVAPKQYFGPESSANQLQADQPISDDQWKTILESPDQGNPNPPKVGMLDRQLEMFRFLTSKTDPSNPFNKVLELENKLQQQLDLIDKKKAEISIVLTAERFARNKALARAQLNNLPKTRKEERSEAKYKGGVYGQFQQGKGLLGFAYLRYGFSFDVLWNAISFLVDQSGDENQFWSTYVPLIWWGPKDQAVPLQTRGSLDVKATFTVPQNRTFYYDGPVTVRGDLWLQRGSTMTVTGDLLVCSPNVALLSKYVQALDMLPSGRIFMEEGSSLIVKGQLYCYGPVVPTGQPHAVRPISTAILVSGDVVLRHGVAPGTGLTDILQSPDLQPAGNTINDDILYPLMSTVFPNMGKVYPLGPFHRRLCFFAKNCTQYLFTVIIGPFGIPIPIVVPYPVPRANINVTLYRGLSLLYAISSNINLGENLYTSCDWWPFGHQATCGIVPILPKLNFSDFALDAGLTDLFNQVKKITVASPAEIASFFGAGLKKLDPTDPNSVFGMVVNNMFTQAIASALASMIPSPFDTVLSPLIMSLLPADDSQGDEASGPYAGLTTGLTGPAATLQTKLAQISATAPVQAFTNSLMHEVTGVLVSGSTIKIGYTPPSAFKGGAAVALLPAERPLLASGLFVARGDIDINAEYTVGAIISSQGSINKDAGCHTKLFFYPAFTRASLFQPGLTPKITTDLNGALPQFLVRAMDVEYGASQSVNSGLKGMDVYYPSTQITAQGWEQ